jgi:cell division protein FtsQ
VRKTTSGSSRSATDAEDADYGELPLDERPRRSRPQAAARVSRFDDFDEEFLAPREQPELERAGPRRNRAARGTRDDEHTCWQWLRGSIVGRCVLAAGTLAIVAVLGITAWAAREFVRTNPLFLVASSDQVQVEGNREVSVADVRAVFGEDIGRNLFFIPVRERQQQLQTLPWVERASVERLLPNQVRVHVTERVPVAFAQDGDSMMLVDRHGVLLTPPTGAGAPRYSFPVLRGIADDVPQSTRQARMSEYLAFLKDVDGHGEQVSSQLSEVDVSDPEDIQAVVADAGSTGALTLHLGDRDYYQRYRMYQVHLAEWQQQMPNLGNVDLRNAPQVVLGKADDTTTDALAKSTPPLVHGPVSTAPASAPISAPVSGPVSSLTSAKAAKVSATRPVAGGKGLPEAGHGFNRANQAADTHGALAPEVASNPPAAVRAPGKTSAARPIAAAMTAPPPAIAPSHRARPVLTKSKAKTKNLAKHAVLLRAKTAKPVHKASPNLTALNHPAAPKPASPAMQAFLNEAPHASPSAPRMMTRVHMPTPMSATSPRAPSFTTPAPAVPRLVLHQQPATGGQP